MHVRMTSDQIGRETLAERVIAAMEKVPRHEFVPIELRGFAYVNSPLPIGHGKTISQPYMNALMADLLEAGPDDVVVPASADNGLAVDSAALVTKLFTLHESLIVRSLGQLSKFDHRAIIERLVNLLRATVDL